VLHPAGKFAGYIFNVSELITVAAVMDIRTKRNKGLEQLNKWTSELKPLEDDVQLLLAAENAANERYLQCEAENSGTKDREDAAPNGGAESGAV
jgi:hypothetical protein